MALLDINGDGRRDLAIGVEGEKVLRAYEGEVHVLFAKSTGLSADGSDFLSRGDGRVPENLRRYSFFGSDIANAARWLN